MTTNEKTSAIQRLIKQNNIDGYLIPSNDPHMSECPPKHWESRSHFSGFTGSAGTIVYTQDKAALWADGRYHIQAAHQIADSSILLMKQGVRDVPTIAKWLLNELPAQGILGFDGMANSVSEIEELQKKLSKKNITLQSIDFVDSQWENRPPMPASTCFLLDTCYAGRSMCEKIEQLRMSLHEKDADAMLVTSLDSVAWLLNLRADDIQNTPYLLAFCLVTKSEVSLFTNGDRIPDAVKEELSRNAIKLCPYEQTIAALQEISEPTAMLCDKKAVSYDFLENMKANASISLVFDDDPIQLLKSVKNEVEIESLISAHAKDGAAMVRFQRELEQSIAQGKSLTENDISAILCKYRSEQPLFIEESFISIVAYGANAAMMHYHPSTENPTLLEPHGFLLTDCGGHYMNGTTDITRTYALGVLTEEEKRSYTLVLKCHIGIARAVFPEGCTGANLDVLSRIHVWRDGLDYRCGTGHGVSFLGGVHEGPQSLRITNHVPFKAGMVITDEPGIYTEGVLGIRTENELLCKPLMETEYGKFLHFESITFAPIDTTPIITAMLDQDEITWLNDYHKLVVEKLSPLLDVEEQAWLNEKCHAI